MGLKGGVELIEKLLGWVVSILWRVDFGMRVWWNMWMVGRDEVEGRVG